MPGYELINKEEYLECRDVLKKSNSLRCQLSPVLLFSNSNHMNL